MAKPRITQSGPIEIVHEGKTHTGRYEVIGSRDPVVHVVYGDREDTTQVGGHKGHEKRLAEMILGELVRGSAGRP